MNGVEPTRRSVPRRTADIMDILAKYSFVYNLILASMKRVEFAMEFCKNYTQKN